LPSAGTGASPSSTTSVERGAWAAKRSSWPIRPVGTTEIVADLAGFGTGSGRRGGNAGKTIVPTVMSSVMALLERPIASRSFGDLKWAPVPRNLFSDVIVAGEMSWAFSASRSEIDDELRSMRALGAVSGKIRPLRDVEACCARIVRDS
jgi:hypothetical protein